MRPLGVWLAGGIFGLLTAGSAAAQSATDPKIYSIEVSPYAGAKLGDTSDLAQPGARIEIEARQSGDDKVKARLEEFGVRDGAEFGDKARWYVFAAASGRAIGLNVRRDSDGLVRNYGWSTDPAALAGDTHIGIGLRKGPVQTSLGYMHREFQPANAMQNVDYDNKHDMVALSFSIKSGR